MWESFKWTIMHPMGSPKGKRAEKNTQEIKAKNSKFNKNYKRKYSTSLMNHEHKQLRKKHKGT